MTENSSRGNSSGDGPGFDWHAWHNSRASLGSGYWTEEGEHSTPSPRNPRFRHETSGQGRSGQAESGQGRSGGSGAGNPAVRSADAAKGAKGAKGDSAGKLRRGHIPWWKSLLIFIVITVVWLSLKLVAYVVVDEGEVEWYLPDIGEPQPIDYVTADTSALAYCLALDDEVYDQATIHDVCVNLVLAEIRSDEERFREAARDGHKGYIWFDDIEKVLGEPEDFLRVHGVAPGR